MRPGADADRRQPRRIFLGRRGHDLLLDRSGRGTDRHLHDAAAAVERLSDAARAAHHGLRRHHREQSVSARVPRRDGPARNPIIPDILRGGFGRCSMLPAARRRSGERVVKTFTASTSRTFGRGNHAAADHFRGRHRFQQLRAGPPRCDERVSATVRSIRLVLDAEMQRMTGGLQVLALANSLDNGNFDAFRRIAAGFLEQYGKDGVVLVADREGRQLFSSVTPDTASLPRRNNRDIVEKVFATRRPYYSNLFFGAVKKRLIVTVEVPVMRDGEVLYTSPSARRLKFSRPSSNSSVPARTGRSRSSMAKAPISRGCLTREIRSASGHRPHSMRRCS